MSAPSQKGYTSVTGSWQNSTFSVCPSSIPAAAGVGQSCDFSLHPCGATSEVLSWPEVRQWAFWLLHPLFRGLPSLPCVRGYCGAGEPGNKTDKEKIIQSPCKREPGMSSCQRMWGAWGRGTKHFPDLWCALGISDRAIRITWATVDPFLLSLSKLRRFLGATCVFGIRILNSRKVKGAGACHGYCIW